jgi:hypothetical protein
MKQQMDKTKEVVARVATGLLWLGLSGGYVAAETFTGSAPVSRITATMSNDRVCRTLATTLEEIPGTEVLFSQSGEVPQSVEVTFVANWPRPYDHDIEPGAQRAGAFIFLFIDGERVDIVSENGGVLVQEGQGSVSNGTHSFTFMTRPIAPGDHVASIHFLDNVLGSFGDPNGTVCVGDRSTVVRHNGGVPRVIPGDLVFKDQIPFEPILDFDKGIQIK